MKEHNSKSSFLWPVVTLIQAVNKKCKSKSEKKDYILYTIKWLNNQGLDNANVTANMK